MSHTKNILLIEDDISIRDVVQLHLKDEGFTVEWVGDGEAGLIKALTNDYALVLLDLNLPKLSGAEVCKALRREKEGLPIIMITSRGSEIDRVVGLEIGADDYVVKPFSIYELTARIRARLRIQARVESGENRDSKKLEYNGLVIDLILRTVVLHGNAVALTRKEFDLLAYLAKHPGRPFSREHLLDEVWGISAGAYLENVNTLILRLRRKLVMRPGEPELIRTARGIGYRFASVTELSGETTGSSDADDEVDE